MDTETHSASVEHDAAVWRSLTPAAREWLGKAFNGSNCLAITYGPWRQLNNLGLVTGEQGEPLRITSRGFDAVLARNIKP